MTDPTEIPTIRQILEDVYVNEYFTTSEFEDLVAALEQRESVLQADALDKLRIDMIKSQLALWEAFLK